MIAVLGGSIAFHKCIWKVIGWDYKVSPPRMKEKSNYKIELTDREGMKAEIQQLPKDQPNIGLGCRLTPDGNQMHECSFRLQQCKQFQARINAAKFTVDKMHQYLLARIIPAVCYASALTNIPPKVCKRMNTYIDLVTLTKLGLNRHTPKAVVYGPMINGGLNYLQFKMIQITK